MFGVVPKALWNNVSPADELNRVFMTCNLLMIDTGKHKVLVETGMGTRWTDKERERFELSTLAQPEAMLESIYVTNGEVDTVIISHLHFDHAGGATRLLDAELTPTFPNAKYYVQNGEWQFAHNANARARASYREDDYKPLYEAGRLTLMDGDTEVVPGVWAKVTGGHTSHHQIIYFESNGSKGVFFADIIPTKGHILPPWVMGYDHYPLEVCDIKSKWLAQAVDENWLVVFDHEPGVPWGHVSRSAAGKFTFNPLPVSTLTERAVLAAV